MNWKPIFRKLLTDEFNSRKGIDPKFSIRRFAKKLKISSSALSQILSDNYTWNLTPKRAAEITRNLGLSNRECNYMLTLLGVEIDRTRDELKVEDYEILINSNYISVHCCHNLAEEERTPEKIGERLGIPADEVKRIISVLNEKGFLKKNSGSGALDAAPIHWKAGDSIPNHVIREYHRINIEIAARALEKLPSEQRDFATMSFIGNPEQIAMAQKELRAVHERIVSIMAVKKDGPQEVFRFSSCLFPVRNFK